MLDGRGRWDLLALATFFIVLAGCALLIDRSGGIMVLISLTPLDFTLISLAAFRLLHLVTYDKIFAFVREYFDKRGREASAPGHRYIDSFLECLWCTGIWSGLIAVTLYCMNHWGQFIIIVLAAAGVASLLQLVSHAIASLRD